MLAVKIIDKRKFWGRKDSERHLQREIEIMSSVRHVLFFFFSLL